MPLALTRANLGDMEMASKDCPDYFIRGILSSHVRFDLHHSWSGYSCISSVSLASLKSSSR